MPPLILIARAGTGLYAGYKLFSALVNEAGKENRVDAAARKRANARQDGTKDLGELEWDEKSGAYVPKKDG